MEYKTKIIMEFKGTKGKWEAKRLANSATLFYINNEELENGQIATCYGINDTNESETNAKLIAAAPEMFEMLKDIMESLQEGESYHSSDIEELLIKITQ